MFEHLKDLLSPEIKDNEKQKPSKTEKIQTATCVLLIEIARADGDFSEDEKNLITDIIKNKYSLLPQSVDELLQFAEMKRKESLDFYQFTNVINSSFSREEKFDLMINLWQLVYSDKILDKYEDYLIKKIGGLLNLDHKDIINGKLFVKEKMKKDNR